jgi:AraC-like DNA-binding protein
MDAFSFDRDEAIIRSTPADHYTLVVVLKGALTFKHAEGDRYCEAGDACLSDMTRPTLMHSTIASHTIMVHVARWFLDEAISPRDVHGPLLRTPAVRLLVDFLKALIPQLPEMETTSALPMARVVRDLLANGLADMPLRTDQDEHRLPVRQRVRAYVERQPTGSLNLARMCQALGVTRSSLNRAFKTDGGVLAYDRRRRLVALHGRLADPTETRSVSDLGYEYGFPEKTHLSRAFREAFGYSPSELRGQALARPPNVAEPGSLQERYKAALRSLS